MYTSVIQRYVCISFLQLALDFTYFLPPNNSALTYQLGTAYSISL